MSECHENHPSAAVTGEMGGREYQDSTPLAQNAVASQQSLTGKANEIFAEMDRLDKWFAAEWETEVERSKGIWGNLAPAMRRYWARELEQMAEGIPVSAANLEWVKSQTCRKVKR